MSDSPRKIIRKAVVALLSTPAGSPPAPPTAAGDRVYNNLAQPLHRDKMPALAVYALEEKPAPDWNSVRPLRSLQMLITTHYDSKEEGGDDLDDLVWAVERAVLDSENLGLPADGQILIEEINWQGTELTIKTPEGIIPGVGSIQLEIKYVWVPSLAALDLAPFERIHGDQLGPPPEDGGAKVEFHVELPQE